MGTLPTHPRTQRKRLGGTLKVAYWLAPRSRLVSLKFLCTLFFGFAFVFLSSAGVLPPQLGELSALEQLHLTNNELYGEITSSVRNNRDKRLCDPG